MEESQLLKDNGNRKSTSKLSLVNNRYFLLIAIGLCLTLNSRYYGGWAGLSTMLLKAKKSSWLCNPEDVYTDARGLEVCKAQLNDIDNAFILWAGGELVGSFVAGMTMDILGPKICAMIGSLMALVAILLTNLHSESMPVLAIGSIIGGLSVNVTSFPAMVLIDAFPSNAALCTAFIIATQSFCSLLPAVLDGIWTLAPSLTLGGIWQTYVFLVMIPVYVMYVLAIPLRRQAPEKETEKSADEEAPPLVQALLTTEFGCIVVVNFFLMIFVNYFQLVLNEMAGVKVQAFLGLIIPLAGPAGLPLGKLCDAIGTPPMILIQLISFTLIYLGLLMGETAVAYLIVAFYVFTTGFSYTAKFTYIGESFPASIQPRIIGIVAALSGTSVFALTFMKENLTPTTWCCLIPTAALSLVPVALFMWHRKSVRTINATKED